MGKVKPYSLAQSLARRYCDLAYVLRITVAYFLSYLVEWARKRHSSAKYLILCGHGV
jgi:hypothetical protein